MGEHTRTGTRPHDGRPDSLGELIHTAVRRAIEVAVDEELTAALGARLYERGGDRGGYRNGTKARTLTGPTGPLPLTVPRARLFHADRAARMSTAAPQHDASRRGSRIACDRPTHIWVSPKIGSSARS